jgi:hypothetical protein
MSNTTAGNTLGTWSLKYGVTSQIAAEFLLGFDMRNKAASGLGSNDMAFGAGITYALVQKENSDFYTGLRLVWNQDKSPADNRCLRTQIPLGFEFSFAGLPEIGFNAEAGIVVDYMKAAKQLQFHTAGGNIGGALGLGVHYYF